MTASAAEGLDVFTLPLDAVTAVEASAGTGKTTTITRLYLRLLVERELPVQRVLVLTYTRAATEELRARIRALLLAVRAALRAGESADAFLGALLDSRPDRKRALGLVEDALRSFDLAAVFTIHGFCQRALADRAFESGQPFAPELVGDPDELLIEVVEDFWRRHLYGASPLFVEHVLAAKLAPARLAELVRGPVGRPYLEVRAAVEPADTPALEARFCAAWAAARACWQPDAVAAALGDTAALRPGRYSPARIAAWLEEIAVGLAAEAPRLALGEGIERLAAERLATATRKGCVAPRHPFFDACTALVAARDALRNRFTLRASALQACLLEQARLDLEARKRRLEVQAYDDLLLRLRAALDDPARGEALAAELRADYPAALVDEFQDTDPVQYAILRRVWGARGLPVFLVGDPKQAIYGFRGADVFAYFAAQREAAGPHPLDVTWRAAPRLVDAVNALFGHVPRPFLLPQIEFRPARPAAAAQRAALTGAGDGDAPLRLWVLDAAASKAEARDRAARAVAGEIARLLALGASGQARLGDAPLGGGHVAVLVRTNDEGRRVREALTACGVASVQQAVDSVFHAPAATEVERVLLAVAEPANAALLRAALATTLLGATGEELLRLAGDEEGWARRAEAFHRWHALWRTHGFARMFRTLLAEENVAPRLLGLPDGERRLTDVLHLAELLAERARAQRGGPDGLVEWLAGRRRAERVEAGDDAQQLRLESDERLVTIVTVHKSKGLEYPIVFCPFLWDGWLHTKQGAALEFHDPAEGDRPCLDLGSARQAAARPLACREELAERLRLLYVALTRARERCYVVWAQAKGAETSPLAWLLHQPGVAGEDPVGALSDHVRGLTPAAWRADLDRVAARAGGAIAVEPLPAARPAARPGPPLGAASLAARRFTGAIPVPWSVVSFSSLTTDQDTGAPAAAVPAGRRDAFTFPRGARAGSCLHAILERIDFADPDAGPRRAAVEAALAAHGFEPEWTPAVLELLARVVATPLDARGVIRLDRVTRADRLDEIEFHYPLAALRPAALARLLRAHGIPAGPLGAPAGPVRGYMKGFVDLVFTCAGRYWLADYKSNWLGDTPADYAAERLPAVMAAHGYHLQYLIYTVALHRWLRLRLPGYAYEAHFGGVFYLFLRGLDPASGPARGVFHDRPARALVEALDALMAAGEARA
ncbi:MAG TPA: exodeoxyribonuclease V subunit beta [Candidatus Binatia bacterium]|nr:exodeoxyribonuclease V subunit beta [Candidatus Binatia bacterium]